MNDGTMTYEVYLAQNCDRIAADLIRDAKRDDPEGFRDLDPRRKKDITFALRYWTDFIRERAGVEYDEKCAPGLSEIP